MQPLLAHALENIWQAVVPRPAAFTVEVLPSIDSTNTELMRRARDGLLEPVLLVAERTDRRPRTAGRAGTAGPASRSPFRWACPWRRPSWSGLSLAVGVSLAHSLHPEVRLKWPNDLWLHQRKLGGILVETAATPAHPAVRQRLVVVGVGINIARPDASARAGPV
jgi:BirA family transcriptional regulator, biotin operon repressor / biotin---[acetyl-CoA-carboxylase] ligase